MSLAKKIEGFRQLFWVPMQASFQSLHTRLHNVCPIIQTDLFSQKSLFVSQGMEGLNKKRKKVFFSSRYWPCDGKGHFIYFDLVQRFPEKILLGFFHLYNEKYQEKNLNFLMQVWKPWIMLAYSQHNLGLCWGQRPLGPVFALSALFLCLGPSAQILGLGPQGEGQTHRPTNKLFINI